MRKNHKQFAIVFLTPLLAAAAAGCPSKGYDRFIPSTPSALQALETGLNAWREGQHPGPIEGSEPKIDFVDSRWIAGRRLQDFEILGEIPGDGPRCFTVRLSLGNPIQEQKVRYYVFGVEPLWIFRQEDYDMMNHWECMDDPRKLNSGLSVRKFR